MNYYKKVLYRFIVTITIEAARMLIPCLKYFPFLYKKKVALRILTLIFILCCQTTNIVVIITFRVLVQNLSQFNISDIHIYSNIYFNVHLRIFSTLATLVSNRVNYYGEPGAHAPHSQPHTITHRYRIHTRVVTNTSSTRCKSLAVGRLGLERALVKLFLL